MHVSYFGLHINVTLRSYFIIFRGTKDVHPSSKMTYTLPVEGGLHEGRPSALNVLSIDLCSSLDQGLSDVPPSKHGGYHEGCGTVHRGVVALHRILIKNTLD